MLADNILLPLAHTYTLGAPTDIYIYVMKFYFHYLLLPENMEIVQNKFNTDVLRKIMFAVHHLPKDMPNYWKTIKEFASVNESSISELQTVVENMEYLYQETFATDEELLQQICQNSVGIVLVSSKNNCSACGTKLTTRGDRPRKLVVYTESSGMLPALHYRKVCVRSGCNYVQHYGYHSMGKYSCDK